MGTAAAVKASDANLNIPQRIERLPITSYQYVIAVSIVSAWFLDCVDLGSMMYMLATLGKEFNLDKVWMCHDAHKINMSANSGNLNGFNM